MSVETSLGGYCQGVSSHTSRTACQASVDTAKACQVILVEQLANWQASVDTAKACQVILVEQLAKPRRILQVIQEEQLAKLRRILPRRVKL